jgi:CheY-like chemotaxis protein
MKILLAEDHEDTAVVYKLALQDKGHVVVHTTNGEDCLKVYHNEILAVNPHQRIIFASAYLQDMLKESIHQLNQIVEILHKPFGEQELIDAVEDKSIYSELKELNVNIDDIKNANLRHEQLREILDILKRGKIK